MDSGILSPIARADFDRGKAVFTPRPKTNTNNAIIKFEFSLPLDNYKFEKLKTNDVRTIRNSIDLT